MTVQLLICLLLRYYSYILLARVILSFVQLFKPDWSPPGFLRPFIEAIYAVTEPPLQLIRRVIPQPMGFPFDLSFLVLYFLTGIVLPQIICR